MAQQPERQRLVVQQNLTALRTVAAPSLAAMQQDNLKLQQQRAQEEAFALQMLRQQQAQQQQALRQQIPKQRVEVNYLENENQIPKKNKNK